MTAAYYPLLIEQGSTFDRTLTLYDDGSYDLIAGEATGEPIDLTGYSARMQIRRNAHSADVLFELTDGDGLTLGDDLGTIRILIDADTSSEWTWRSGEYDLELVQPSGDPIRLFQGDVKVSPEVTHP